MSEYWKSTPKYWCKHCKTFVKDTKLEKTNHEASPKHQGNLKRFLRDLHKGHEREERDKQRAKDEVDRLNGVVSGSGYKTTNPWERKPTTPVANTLRQATPADRKKQLAQLAELGVAVPEDFRKEMAMVGDWQVTSQTPIYDTVKKEEGSEEFKPEGLNVGVRKRKFEGQEEECEAGETVVRRGWGSTTRTYPTTVADGEDDLDTLLNTTKNLQKPAVEPEASLSESQAEEADKHETLKAPVTAKVPPLKREESSNPGISDEIPKNRESTTIKQEDEPIPPLEPASLFKKRKAKPIRQK